MIGMGSEVTEDAGVKCLKVVGRGKDGGGKEVPES